MIFNKQYPYGLRLQSDISIFLRRKLWAIPICYTQLPPTGQAMLRFRLPACIRRQVLIAKRARLSANMSIPYSLMHLEYVIFKGMKLLSKLLLLSLFLIYACGDDSATDPDIYSCSDLEQFIARVKMESENDNYIMDRDFQDGAYIFTYVDGLQLSLLEGEQCEQNNLFGNDGWSFIMQFIGGSTSGSLKRIGNIFLDSSVNPNGYCPLMSTIETNLPAGLRVRSVVQGKHGSITDVVQEHVSAEKNPSLAIYGLYPDYENTIELEVYSASGDFLKSISIDVQTDPIELDLPEIVVSTMDTVAMQEGLTLISERLYSKPNRPFMIDAYGDVRWYLVLKDHPQLSDLIYDVGMERLQNGNLYFGDLITDSVYEMDWSGEVVSQISLAPYQFHHNVYEKPDGNFLVTVTDLNSTHQNGTPTVEDFILEITPEGVQLKQWDLKDFLDENRTAWDDNLDDLPVDWAHANSVVYDPSDNTIIVSCRLQGAIKIGYDDAIKWIIGPHRGWGQNRRGEDLNQFLLQALDADGNPIMDTAVLDGVANHPDFEWNWYQHAVDKLPNGDFILFDNGDKRNFTGDERYSRAVQYRVDESNKTIQQIWDYGKERGLFAYSFIVSDVDRLDNGNILFAPGHRVNNMNGEGGKLIEINPETDEEVWEVEIAGQSGRAFHRVERIVF